MRCPLWPRAVLLALLLAFTFLTPALAAPASPALPAAAVPDVPRGPRIYLLPFPRGMSFTMCQGNNHATHTGNGLYAWDFCMPIGTPVTASRGGTVKWTEQRFDANGEGPEWGDKANIVVVDHGDGSSAMYMHLMFNGVRVGVGQRVETGQLLAYSGNTGWSHGPHTHFMVMQSSPYDWYARSLPVAFADVPTPNGVPADRGRYPSGNAAIDPSLILPPCDLGVRSAGRGFQPFWVENHRPTEVWSGIDGQAVGFGEIGPWQHFLVLAPQAGARLQVRVAATGGTAFVPAVDVGPSGPPPPDGACQPSSGRG